MKKKIFAALSALTLGATMMGGMAMTASAADVYNTADEYVGDGGFQLVYRDYNGDGNIDTGDFEDAPGGMYDGMISEDGVTLNSNGSVTMELISATITYHGVTATGTISSIKDSSGNEKVSSGIATINPNEVYSMVVTFTAGTVSFPHTFDTARFVITPATQS